MKAKILLLIISFFIFPFAINAEEVTLNLFYGKECPHCEAEQEYLKDLKKEYKDELKINKFEVWHNEDNRALLSKVKKAFGDDDNYVPYTVIGTQSTTGYSEATQEKIKEMIENAKKTNAVDAVSYISKGKELPKDDSKIDKENIKVPILGKINVKEVSLPLLSAILGLVDGFNPCAMWVLLFLIAMLVQVKDKKRMLILGLTFLFTSALMYTLIMVSWLLITSGAKNILTNITSMSSTSIIILKVLISLVALIVGAINLKSYIKTRKNPDGCEVVDDEKRSKILAKIKKLTHEKSLLLAIVGIATLAISVNLVELACSAGIPLVYTSALVLNNLNVLQYAIYIFIYVLFFMLDDIVVFLIAYKTMEVTGISTKYSKYAHLVGGVVMIGISIFLIIQSGLF